MMYDFAFLQHSKLCFFLTTWFFVISEMVGGVEQAQERTSVL